MTNFKVFLGKDNGTTLDSHSLLVCKIALIMCDYLEVKNETKKIIKISALLHDIGKVIKLFQDILNKKDIKEKKRIFHNIIGWSILSKILQPTEENRLILNSIYWHHSKPELKENSHYMCTNDEILNDLSEEDINTILEYVKYVVELHNIVLPIKSFDGQFETPHFYDMEDKNNVDRLLIRSLLISADRMSSQFNKYEVDELLNNDEKCKSLIFPLLKNEEFVIIKPEHYDSERFNLQLKTIEDIKNNQTSVVKAPAGSGKTLLGIMWGNGDKLLWVTPRNVVADVVYDGIIKELKALNLNNISVELYYTKKRQKCTDNSIPDFESDIIVTNIDNFLFPVVENNVADRQFMICSRKLVCDEVHELISDSAYFYGFINIMRLRHRKTNSKTLLLSATPTPLNYLWDFDFSNKKTRIYPNDETHLPAQHKNNYKINFLDDVLDNVIAEIDNNKQENSLIINNSITISQQFYNDLNFDYLLHSDFLDEDFSIINKTIMDRFGKNNTNQEIMNVCSTPVFEASCDISFPHLYDVTKSPQSTLQRIGRCDRWGNEPLSSLTFIRFTDNQKSNIEAIKITYDNKLMNMWYDFLKDSLKGREYVNLDELYIIYNQFESKFSKEIKGFIDIQIRLSLQNLCKIYPIKIVKDNDYDYTLETKRPTGNRFEDKEKLRGNDIGKIFFVIRIFNEDSTQEETYTYPLTKKPYTTLTIDKYFDQDENSLTNVKKIIKKISNLYKYPRKFTKDGYFSLEELAKNAKYEDKPYIVTNWYYHPSFGILKNKTVSKFNRILNNKNKINKNN